MCIELNKLVDVFVKSYDKETLDEDIHSGKVTYPFIAKPRGGFASRLVEIILNHNDRVKINDNHILQELAIPHKSAPNREYFLKQIEKNITFLPQIMWKSLSIDF